MPFKLCPYRDKVNICACTEDECTPDCCGIYDLPFTAEAILIFIHQKWQEFRELRTEEIVWADPKELIEKHRKLHEPPMWTLHRVYVENQEIVNGYIHDILMLEKAIRFISKDNPHPAMADPLFSIGYLAW